MEAGELAASSPGENDGTGKTSSPGRDSGRGERARRGRCAAQHVPAAGPPRKVVVGSLMYSMWGPYPGVARRLEVLSSFIDAMSKTARQKYHVGLDIAALPETAVTGEVRGSARDTALPLEGAVRDALGAAARRNRTYVVAPLYLAEDAAKTRLYNACVLLDRQGKVAGIYRKVHPVASGKASQLEGGVLPGKDFPVFACDFGTVGLQICYDMYFDAGWAALARKGAELVIWPTQSPQIIGAVPGAPAPLLRPLQHVAEQHLPGRSHRRGPRPANQRTGPAGRADRPELRSPGLAAAAPQRRSPGRALRQGGGLSLQRGRGRRDLLVQRS